jgi:hypothetical protein
MDHFPLPVGRCRERSSVQATNRKSQGSQTTPFAAPGCHQTTEYFIWLPATTQIDSISCRFGEWTHLWINHQQNRVRIRSAPGRSVSAVSLLVPTGPACRRVRASCHVQQQHGRRIPLGGPSGTVLHDQRCADPGRLVRTTRNWQGILGCHVPSKTADSLGQFRRACSQSRGASTGRTTDCLQSASNRRDGGCGHPKHLRATPSREPVLPGMWRSGSNAISVSMRREPMHSIRVCSVRFWDAPRRPQSLHTVCGSRVTTSAHLHRRS